MLKLGAVVDAALAAVAAAVVMLATSSSSPPASGHVHVSTRTAARVGGHPIPETRISIVSHDVRVTAGVARVRLSCQMGEAIRLTCHGVLSLQALRAADAPTAGAGSVLGRTRFAIPNCCSAPWHVVDVRLDPAGTRLVGSSGIRVRAHAVLDHAAASATQTVRLVRNDG